jgi:hypothetical protein
MLGKKCSVSELFYVINPDERKLLDSSYIGNIAASNAVWVITFGARRKKGNIKKTASLRNIAPVNYSEGSNDDDEEEYIEEEGGVAYQYHTHIPNVSTFAKKLKTILKRHSSPEPSPSSSQKTLSKRTNKHDPASKTNKKRKILDLDESGSNNSILEVKILPKKDQDMKLIKEQLKVTQEQYAKMSKHILELHNQLTSKPAVKSDPETTSPIKEIAPKRRVRPKRILH